jgi:hypothetical protein
MNREVRIPLSKNWKYFFSEENFEMNNLEIFLETKNLPNIIIN